MRAREERLGSSTPEVLLGRGRRPHELGAVVAALASLARGAAADSAGGSDVARRLDDLEDLLVPRLRGESGAGTLILECEEVPAEDIGFVRRFLERHPGWRLVVLGEEAGDARARTLLSLPRAQWLPWPPDLEQLRGLAGGERDGATPASPPAPPPASTASAPRASASAGGGKARPGAPQATEVAAVVEELLTGLSDDVPAGTKGPRLLFRGERSVVAPIERGLLARGLAGLLALARGCAGAGEVVQVSAEPLEGGARVAIDFPAGPLSDGDLPRLLDAPYEGDPALAGAAAAAREGAGLLREAGAAIELFPRGTGRLRLEVDLVS
jgi:hypothetical protein